MDVLSARVYPSSRKAIDEAVGILIGWRGCTEREASEEIERAARDTGVRVVSLAQGLVSLATGTADADPHGVDALRLWGTAMPAR